MEIRDYIEAVRQRLWLPIGLPLIAGFLTFVVLMLQPVQYQAVATVVVPSLSNKGYSTSAVTQYFSTFKDVLVSTPVLDKVAQQTGVKRSELNGTLTANTATASSNIIEVTYSGRQKTKSASIAKFAAMDAMDALVMPQLAATTAAVVSTQNGLDKANKALTDFTTSTGLLSPDEEFRIKDQQVSQLLVQLQQAKLAGDSARANGLQQIISTRQAELSTLAGQVQQYDLLKENLTASEAAHNHAVQQQADAEATITSNHDPASVSVRQLGHVSRLPTIAKFVGIAVAAALFLSLAYLVLMELIRPTRRVPMMTVTQPAPVFANGHDAALEPTADGHSNNGHAPATEPATPIWLTTPKL